MDAAPDAIASLVEDVRRLVRRRVDDPAVRDDLVQEVLLRVHDRRDQLLDDERLAGWVRRIAANVISDHYRRGRRRDPEALPEELAAPRPDSADDPTDRALLAAWLGVTVRALPEHHREVLELTELQGLTQREAAELLGLSLPAVKARVRRGRAELLRRLERCCHLELDHRGALVGYAPRTPYDPARCCPPGSDD
ncbi:MAG: sigma-70 family RNA polymerase sigma factor [Nannocystaceae bacterium]